MKPQRGATPLHAIRPRPFEPVPVDEEVFLDVLGEACALLDEAGIPYGLMGGLASAVYGRPRWTRDIDFFVRQHDAEHALDVFARAGYATEKTNAHWIFKAYKDGVLVDVIFRAKGEIYLDEEMERRLVASTFRGRSVHVIPPEDLVVIKAIIHDEETPRHWHDALSIIATAELDWDYLMRRATSGPRRVLSLLVYAQSVDLVVPEPVIRALFESAHP